MTHWPLGPRLSHIKSRAQQFFGLVYYETLACNIPFAKMRCEHPWNVWIVFGHVWIYMFVGPHCPFLVLFAFSFYVSKRWQKSLRQKPASFSCDSCIVQKSWGFISLACVRCGRFEDLPRTTSTATQSSASSKWGTKLPSWTVASTLSQFKFGSPQWQARPLQDVPDWLMSLSCNFMMVKCWLCLNRFRRRFKA